MLAKEMKTVFGARPLEAATLGPSLEADPANQNSTPVVPVQLSPPQARKDLNLAALAQQMQGIFTPSASPAPPRSTHPTPKTSTGAGGSSSHSTMPTPRRSRQQVLSWCESRPAVLNLAAGPPLQHCCCKVREVLVCNAASVFFVWFILVLFCPCFILTKRVAYRTSMPMLIRQTRCSKGVTNQLWPRPQSLL